MTTITIIACIVVGSICWYLACQADKEAAALRAERDRLIEERDRLLAARDELQDNIDAIVHVRGKRWP